MEIRIATAPVSWGVLLKDTPHVPPWEQTLDEIQQAGYTGTELGPYSYLPLDQDLLKVELDQRGLTLLSAYVPINLRDPQLRPDEYQEGLTTARFLSQMGCEWLVLSDALFVDDHRANRAGRIRPEDGLSGADWQRFVQNTDDIARRVLDEFGLKTVYHPHVGAYVESPQEVDRFLADTDSDFVGLCLDTAHSMYGGDDPVDLCRRAGSRVRYLHLKECDRATLEEVRANEWDYFRAVEVGVFPELGQGSVDFAGMLEVLKELDYQGWAVVEQDILPETGADPLASARRNLDFLQEIGVA